MKKYANHSGPACFIVLPLKTMYICGKGKYVQLRAWTGT